MVALLTDSSLRVELADDETDGHDLELLRRVQQPHTGALASAPVLERDLIEADEGVADVRRVMDR